MVPIYLSAQNPKGADSAPFGSPALRQTGAHTRGKGSRRGPPGPAANAGIKESVDRGRADPGSREDRGADRDDGGHRQLMEIRLLAWCCPYSLKFHPNLDSILSRQ